MCFIVSGQSMICTNEQLLPDKLVVTRNYFDNLLRALENGLSDVDSHGGCSRAASSKNGGSSKASRGGGRGKGTTNTRAGSSRTDVINVKSATTCQMCQHCK
ncbi:hypothetical protein EUGRSUZ_H01797 [Eucalyptus grandis]|uniref:Uncharacterized protein n=2 Tax=Eucalyptus grandis TaxID=71139 RepID=A0ACC3JRJ7_EUCGR|nr:hypothetical protein EUGRSUZ_H01797 [Eucalyptus grandis]